MASPPTWQPGTHWLRPVRSWLTGWWQIPHLGAVMLVLALSPACHGRAQRRALAHQLVAAAGPMLAGFSVVSALVSLVVIHIVVVTALSYGLSQYALEMVVRVLVLELIPLAAALFTALRCTLPMAADIHTLRRQGGFEALAARGRDPRSELLLPRVLAGMFAVGLAAAVSGLLTLVLAYLSVHGFTLGGLDRYTRTVGRIFSPAVTLIFALKVFFLSGAVSLIPMAAVLQAPPRPRPRTSAELQGLVRMFMVMLLIEAASLVGNYY